MQSLDDQLKLIETRLTRIENQLQLAPISPTAEQKSVYEFSADTAQEDRKDTRVKLQLSSGSVLGIIAIICFVVAAGFIIKLSIDAGLMSPATRLIIASIFGFSLIGTGIKLLSTDRAYASLLPAAGIIVLYLVTFAAHRVYFLIPFEIAMAMSTGISLLCIGLYWKIKHSAYCLAAAIGAYTAPIVLSATNTGSIFLLYYFMICSLTFTALAILVTSRLLIIISAYLAIILTMAAGNNLHLHSLTVAILTLQFFIISIGVLCYTLFTRHAMDKTESTSFLPLLIIFYIAESQYGFAANPTFAAWHALGFAAFLIALYLTAIKLMPTTRFNSWPVISAFAALTCFHAGYYELLPYALGPWLFSALMVTLAFLPITDWNNKTIKSSYYAFVILGLAIIVIEYIKMVIMLAVSTELIEIKTLGGYAFIVAVFDTIFVDQSSIPPLITYYCAILSIWTLFIFQNNFFSKTNTDLGYLLLFAAHILMILVLYDQTTDISSLAVTASWLVYATIVIMFAFKHRDKLLANSALLILGLAAGKALIYDASSTPTIVRIFCLLSTGIVLYFAGYLFRKIGEWKD